MRTRGEWVVTIDEDLEHPPESIPLLLAKGREGSSVVYGVNATRTHAWWRNLTSEIGRSMFKTAIPTLNRDYTSFRLVHSSVAKQLERFQSPFTFIDGYISWITNRYATVTVPHGVGAHSKSSYSFRTLTSHMLNIFVTFSNVPLRFAAWIGLLASFVGGVWGVYIVLAKALGSVSISGYTSLVAGMTFMGGLQLLILGVFGEYIARINFRVASMPLYLIEQETKA